ncbi:MAG: YicC family protein [Bacteroidetes bacterium]|nr:MAG: YicC family protein [Bacteroidota bacterium]PIE88656.1 MAG: YicC family protein [Bacteroidota bacterium]
MIKSMTGYGKKVVVMPGKRVTIELRSLNSKQFDFNPRIHPLYREKEQAIRQMVSGRLLRGKVDLFIFLELTGSSSNQVLNKELALGYYRQLKELEAMMETPVTPDYLPLLVRMPDVLSTTVQELGDAEWALLQEGIDGALEAMDAFRTGEGLILEKDLRMRLANIQQLLHEIEPFEQVRVEKVRQNLEREMKRWIEIGRVDQNRFEQELVYYLEKLDITEEKVRLQRHCDYFLETLDAAEAQGKKLGFIAQEMGREINTIGSKANEANIQKIVVQMKDELEKVKEQLANIL